MMRAEVAPLYFDDSVGLCWFEELVELWPGVPSSQGMFPGLQGLFAGEGCSVWGTDSTGWSSAGDGLSWSEPEWIVPFHSCFFPFQFCLCSCFWCCWKSDQPNTPFTSLISSLNWIHGLSVFDTSPWDCNCWSWVSCLNSQQIIEKGIWGKLVPQSLSGELSCFSEPAPESKALTGHVKSGEWEQTVQNSPIYLLGSCAIPSMYCWQS